MPTSLVAMRAIATNTAIKLLGSKCMCMSQEMCSDRSMLIDSKIMDIFKAQSLQLFLHE